MSEIKIVTGLAAVFSLGTILTCLIAVPAIYYEVQDIWNEIDTDMREFRVLTDDAWVRMQVNGKNRENRRVARQAYGEVVRPTPVDPITSPPRREFNRDKPAPIAPKCRCNPHNSCPPGPPGARGAPGRPGMEGQPGLDGPNGRDAADVNSLSQMMNQCFYCPPGKQGPAGAMGGPGIVGKRGARGQDGNNGRNGRPGPPGPKGDVGPEGESGTPGPLGDPGMNGSAGRGLPGLKGIPGEGGDRGEQGFAGKNGKDGEIGRRGPLGLRGRPGRSGLSGPQGKMGITGPPGRDAQYCPCPKRQERLRPSFNQDQGYAQPAPAPKVAKPAPSRIVSANHDKGFHVERTPVPRTRPAPRPTPVPANYGPPILPASPAPPSPPAPAKAILPPEHPAVLVPIEARKQEPVVRRVNSNFHGSQRRPAWNRDPRRSYRGPNYGRKL